VRFTSQARGTRTLAVGDIQHLHGHVSFERVVAVPLFVEIWVENPHAARTVSTEAISSQLGA
jgi:hypothetical protein